MNITFIGGGNMAGAIIGGLLGKGYAAGSLRVVEIAADARRRLEQQYAVKTYAAIAADAVNSDCIVLAVKPQQMREVAAALRPLLQQQLVISIAAGIRSSDLSRWLGGCQKLVRAMPNTPALVGAGCAGLHALPGVSGEDRARVEAILGAVGSTLWLEREELLNAITAVSGSGPAYAFYFIEALQAAAHELGVTEADARRLALETFSGAVKLAAAGTEDPATLRARVTSKGGTTEAALASMAADHVKEAIIRAVNKACERSRELGDELGKD
ncbi:MAG: pyrroline-5-carboxylate reductase [Betaproteobacteria bacterium]|nr:pyrroline-5-carboxylate reductase [Betaproteobacteria bacterium]